MKSVPFGLVLLAVSAFGGTAEAGPLRARAIASVNAGHTDDKSREMAASATSQGLMDGRPQIAQAHVAGFPYPVDIAPDWVSFYLGASAESDSSPLLGAGAVSLASASWWDKMTIVTPTPLPYVYLYIGLGGHIDVSIRGQTVEDFPWAEAEVRLAVNTQDSGIVRGEECNP